MFHEAAYKLQAHDVFFNSYKECNQFAEPIKERLIRTKPSPSSDVKYYCFQVPEST
jgi:hypothetical protein